MSLFRLLSDTRRTIVDAIVHRKSAPPQKTQLDLAQLEDRVMLSATPVAVIQPDIDPALESGEQVATIDQVAVDTTDHETANQSEADVRRRELVFVDTATENYQQLVDDLLQNAGDEIDLRVELLDANRDGVEQISSVLEDEAGLNAIHFVTHGTEGGVKLGNTWLRINNLAAHSSDIVQWDDALTDGADLLFYGCDLASNESGRLLVESISELTGADVAASVDDTGHVLRGGDWDLEYRAGEITTAVAFSQSLQNNWDGLLANETILDEFNAIGYSGNDGSMNWSNDWFESGDGGNTATTGDIRVVSGGPQFSTNVVRIGGDEVNINGAKLTREADLSTAVSAQLDFLYRRELLDEVGGSVELQVSSDGANFTTLQTYNFNGTDSSAIADAFDISAYISNQTQVRFCGNGNDVESYFYVDDVQISYSTTGNNSLFVTTTNDLNNGDTSSIDALIADDGGDGISLREAILATNNTLNAGTPDRIFFNITGGGVHTISLTQSLPDINESLILDASTQPGYAGTPLIEIDGGGLAQDGFRVNVGTSTIRGFAINNTVSHGIFLNGGAMGTTVDSNFIGTDATGTSVVGVGGNGIRVESINNTISNNVIGGATSHGIEFAGAADNNTLKNNFIGTDLSSTLTLGNSGNGIHIDGQSFIAIGSTTGNGNTIANNGGTGIVIVNGNANTIRGNSIFANGGLGIDLGGDLVTQNDHNDNDSGANDLVNYPFITDAIVSGTDLTIYGTVQTSPSAVVDVDLYSSPTPDGSGFGEGKTFLGTVNVAADMNGEGTFTLKLSNVAVPVGDVISATATDSLTGATSEFSPVTIARQMETTIFPPTSGAPVIDGTIDAVWNEARVHDIENLTVGSVSSSTDLSAHWRTLWNATSLFVLVEVTDDSLINDSPAASWWDDDAVELFVDADFSHTASYDGNDFQFGFRYNDLVVRQGTNSAPFDPNDITFNMVTTAGGYVLEAEVPWTTLGVTPTAGNPIGIDVAVSDDDDGGIRDGQLTWSAVYNNAFFEPRTFGRALLSNSPNLSGGNEVRVNTQTTDQQILSHEDRGSHQSIAVAATGQHVVVWSSLNQSAGGGYDIYGQLYDAAGNTIGSEFQVNSFDTGDQKWAAVDMDDDGNFVVVWTSENQDGTTQSIYAQRYDNDGARLGGEFRVNTEATGDQWDPSVAMDSDGDFLVAWQGNGPSDSNGVFARRFDSHGIAITQDFVVNPPDASTQANTAAASDKKGNVVVVWDEFIGFYAQRIDAEGNLQGSRITIDTSFSAGDGDVAVDADGDFVAVWREDFFGNEFVQAELYDAQGNLKNPPGTILVNTNSPGDQSDPSVDTDAHGNFIVVWEDDTTGTGWDIYGRRFWADGTAIDANDVLNNETTAGDQRRASAALLDINNFVVVWSGNGDQPGEVDSDGVFSRQFFVSNNLPPVVTLPGGTLNFTEGDGATVLDSSATVTDADSSDYDTGSMTVDFTAGSTANDRLSIRDEGPGANKISISGSNVRYDFGGGPTTIGTFSGGGDGSTPLVINLNASADDTAVQALARNITYDNVAQNPSAASRTVRFVVNDGDGGVSTAVTMTVNVAPVNDPITNTVPGTQVTGQDVPVVFSSLGGNAISISDPDADPAGVEVTLTATNGTVTLNWVSGEATAAGGEINVNTTTANTQATLDGNFAESGNINSPQSVATHDDGTFVVTWSSRNQDGDNWGVFAQRFDAAGAKVGPEFQVNTQTSDRQQYSSIAMDSTGDFVITWSSQDQDGDGWGIFAQRFDASGAAQGGEIQVNTTTTDDQLAPQIATNDAGDFVITWSSKDQDGDNWGVYGQRFNASGVTQGGEFQVNSATSNEQMASSIAMDADGDFVITWSSKDQDGDNWGVYAQRYDASGVAQGGEFQVNSTTTDQQRFSSIAMDDNGNFVITWASKDQDGDNWGVYAQRYNASGVAQGGEFQVNTTTNKEQTMPAVTMDADGDFAITWSSKDQDGDNWGVYLQQYDSSGATQGSETLVNTTTSGAQEYSAISMNGQGDFVVAWTGGGGVRAQRFVNNGNLTFTVGDGVNDATMTFTGTVMDINAALDGLTFTPTTGFNGYGFLDVGSNDLGNTGSGGPYTDNDQIQITIGNLAPVLTMPGGAVSFTEGDPPVLIDINATVTDGNNTNFDTGTLTVALGAAGTNDDRLAVNNEGTAIGQVSVVGSDVFYNFSGTPVQIGSFTGGSDGSTPLVVTFNTASDAPSVEAVVQNVTFENVSQSPGATSRTVTFTVTDGDGGTSNVENETINITPVNDPPTDLSLSNTSVDENTDTTSGFSVATITPTDLDMPVDTFTYFIVGGADAASFSIGGSSSDELILTDGVLDFETKPSYEVRIRVEDSATAAYEETFTITVNDINEPPTITLINTTTSLPENTIITTPLKVADIVVTDDALGTETFSLSGADAALFEISGFELHIKAGTTLDFETKPLLNVTVEVDDASIPGNPDDTDSLAINVTDVNEPPTIALTGTTTTLPENTDISSALKVADIVVTDDALGTEVITLSGSDAALFEVVGTELRIQAGTVLDFETNPSLDVTVNIDDSTIPGNPDDSDSLTITVTNINEPPTVTLTSATTTLPEDTNLSTSLKVADIVVTDDGTGTNVLSLTGADASLFEISGTELRIIAGTVLDFETNPSLDVTVNVNDAAIGGNPDDSDSLTINVTDVNEPPTITLTNPTTSLAENADTSSALKVADIVVTDDGLGTETISLSGADSALFEIVGTELRLRAGTPLDFETNPVLDVTVNVDDVSIPGTPDDFDSLALAITDVNEVPTITAIADQVTLEDVSTSALTFTIDDQESAASTLIVSAVSSNQSLIPNANLILAGVGATRTITVKPADDAFGGPTTITVTVSDGSLQTQTSFTVNILPQQDPPVAVAESFSIPADQNLSGNVLGNDYDVDFEPLTAILVTDVSEGTLTLNADGSFTYLPDSNFVGVDAFSYKANDGTSDSNVVVVTIMVDPPLIPPPPPEPPPEEGGESGGEEPPPQLPPPPEDDSQPNPDPPPPRSAARPVVQNANATVVREQPAPASSEARDTFVDLGFLSRELTESKLISLASTSEINAQTYDLAAGEATFLITGTAMWDNLDQLQDVYESNVDFSKIVAGSSVTVSSMLTAGYVLWTIRGGYLLSSLLANIPAWQLVNPLMVLDELFDEDADPFDDEDDESAQEAKKVENIFDEK